MRWRLGLRLRPHWGLISPPDSLPLRGAQLRGGEKGRERRSAAQYRKGWNGREGKGREGRDLRPLTRIPGFAPARFWMRRHTSCMMPRTLPARSTVLVKV